MAEAQPLVQPHNPPTELELLRLVQSLQDVHLPTDDIELAVVRAAKDLLGASYAVLTLRDSEEARIFSEKKYIGGEAWSAERAYAIDTQRQEPSTEVPGRGPSGSVQRPSPSEAAPRAYPPFKENPRELELTLRGDSLVLGTIQLVSPRQDRLTQRNMALLDLLTSTLANSLYTRRLIQQLKTANANLEANRWELINSRNTLRALFDSLPLSIYIVDREYTLIAVNLARARRAAVRPAQLIGKRCYEALFHRSDVCPGCHVNETLSYGVQTDRSAREPAGEPGRDWEISTYPILDEQKAPYQAILIEEDVTEQRSLENDLIQSEKLAAVGQLAAGVAHEINNPLAAIIANAQLLERDLPADADTIESLALIEEAGQRASLVVRGLLDFAHRDTYDFEPTDINKSIQSAVALAQHEIVSRAIDLTLDLSDDLPTVAASPTHIQEVWINLIMNALDAITSQEGKIALSTTLRNGEVMVSVSDNGSGIPEERLGKIFDPFYTTKPASRGTGLGLSLAQRIITQHGGRISVESQEGVGTTFYVFLPLNEGGS
jgi:two-component system NtrC family sensor kinase